MKRTFSKVEVLERYVRILFHKVTSVTSVRNKLDLAIASHYKF